MTFTPCRVCGTPTEMRGTRLCDICWNIERGLDRYSTTEAGQARLVTLLRERGYTVSRPEES